MIPSSIDLIAAEDDIGIFPANISDQLIHIIIITFKSSKIEDWNYIVEPTQHPPKVMSIVAVGTQRATLTKSKNNKFILHRYRYFIF